MLQFLYFRIGKVAISDMVVLLVLAHDPVRLAAAYNKRHRIATPGSWATDGCLSDTNVISLKFGAFLTS